MGREPYYPVTTNLSATKFHTENMNESLNPMLGDESVGVENFLVEPKSDHVSVDSILCLNEDNIPKCLQLEDFSLGFDYGFKTNLAGLGSFDTHTEDELKFEMLDGLLNGVDEVHGFHAASDFANACGDFLLDVEYGGEFSGLECGPSDGSQLGNSTIESQSPGFSGSNNGAIGVSDSSMGTSRELECINEMNQKTVFYGKNDLLCGATFENKKGSNSLEELDEEKPLMNFIMSRKTGKNNFQSIKREIPSRDQRFCKPSRRLVAELSDKNSGFSIGKKENFAATSRDQMKDRIHELRFGRESSQIPYESRPRRGPGCQKKSAAVLQCRESNSDGELSPSETGDVHVKKKNFRGASSHTLLESNSDDEFSPSESEDDHVKKNFRGASSWTLLESNSDDELSPSESEDDHVKKKNFCRASSQTLLESNSDKELSVSESEDDHQWCESDDEQTESESEDVRVKKNNFFCGTSSQTLSQSRLRRGPGRPKKSTPTVQRHGSDDEPVPSESDNDRVKKRNRLSGPSSQTESQPKRGCGRPKKSTPVLQWHMSSSDEFSESEEGRVKNKKSHKSTDRRKNHRVWTLTEVTTLVDGISQYGTSRWTDIKRNLFPSSSYRTPIDLRDKWRNLLRASCALKQRVKKEVKQKQKQALPMSLLLRVRELANSNSYPTVRGSKRSNLEHEDSPPTVGTTKPCHHGRKNKYVEKIYLKKASYL
ncbi:hypothetical protein ACFE04_001876 [Oxalis oulophora]